jgi:uncharacterized membrane protein
LKQRERQQVPWAGVGLVFGAALGTLIAILFFDSIAIGAAIGAGLGLVVGAVVGQIIAGRTITGDD